MNDELDYRSAVGEFARRVCTSAFERMDRGRLRAATAEVLPLVPDCKQSDVRRHGAAHTQVATMRSFDALDDLLRVLDENVSLLTEEADDRRAIVRLPDLLQHLASEPLLSSALAELREEADRRLSAFRLHDESLLRELTSLWPRYRASFESLRATLVESQKVKNFDRQVPFGGIDRLLRGTEPVTMDHREPGCDDSASWKVLQQWKAGLQWKNDRIDGANPDAECGGLHARWQEMEQRHKRAFRRYWRDGRNLPGFAVMRLQLRSKEIHPEPEDDVEHLFLSGDVRREVYDQNSDYDFRDMKATAGHVRRDVSLLRQGIRTVLLLGRSRRSLIRRFAARCERYEAARLRELGQGRRAEIELTSRFARFLFDQGLNPVTDAPVAGLRPDVLDFGAPFYVEAKQYRKNPRSALKRAVGQVFDTWGRLRATWPLDEAFLLVFRLGGPRLEMPECVPVDGRKLYIAIVDVAPPAKSGSRQQHRPVVIGMDELIEWSGSSTPMKSPTRRGKKSREVPLPG